MFRRIPQGQTIRSLPTAFRSGKQRMRRLSRDTIAWSVLALPDDYIHYRRHRIPTVREMARLQSFDDNFAFLGTRTTSDKRRRLAVPQYNTGGQRRSPNSRQSFGNGFVPRTGRSSNGPSRPELPQGIASGGFEEARLTSAIRLLRRPLRASSSTTPQDTRCHCRVPTRKNRSRRSASQLIGFSAG